jgi:hypothetical protein
MLFKNLKLALFISISLFSFTVFSEGGLMGFVRSFSLFGRVNESHESLLNQCHRKRLDPKLETHAHCADKLCKDSSDSSLYLSGSSIDQRLENSEEASTEFSNLEAKLEENLRGLEQNQRALMELAKSRGSGLLNQVDSLTPKDFQSLANRVLSPYISDYRWDTTSDSPFIYVPDEIEGQNRVALEHYGQSAWQAKASFPTVVTTEQTVEQQRQSTIDVLNRALEVSKNNPTAATGDVKFIESYVAGQLELVAKMQGRELETLLLESERKLQNYFAIEEDLGIVNQSALEFCSSESCKELVKFLVKKEMDEKISEATSRSSDDVVREALAVCQSQFFSTYLDQVSDEDARQKYETVLNDFVDKGMSNISTSSKAAFKQFALRQAVRSQSQNTGTPSAAKAHFDRQRKPPGFDVAKFFSEDQKIFKTLAGLSDSLMTDRFDVNSICPENLVNVGAGSFISSSQSSDGQGRFQVGQGLGHHFAQGKQIIARELSYLLTDSLDKISWSDDSKKALVVMRNCSVQNYAPGLGDSVGQEFSLFENDNFTTEDDFADLMAFRTYQNEPELFSCGLFKDVSNSSDLTDYHLFYSASDSRSSTPFFRLLQEAIHKRKDIPQVCSDILSENSDRIGTQSCF